ncbi:MAG: ammonium transporter [Firmicutes bacterium]|nr:ammonium transporter [Bacillota bacterium]
MANFSALDTIWLILGAVLVYWMQAGFAMVEAGFTRAKNAGNIIMKNLMDFVLGSIAYWIIGYGIMFGGLNAVFGGIDIFTRGSYDTGSVPFWVHFMFNTVFCATSATIVSGAMAERTKFISYLVYSLVISALIYPLEAHWIWGGGWLSTLTIGSWTGFHDYAGSTVVHMVGGISALIGAKILGPRIGKYDENGKARAIPGHNLTIGALGVFILWMGWFGFNPASSYGLSTYEQGCEVGNVFMTTNIAACMATLVTMIFTWIKYGKPDVSMTLNGSLAGLVAITAGCAAVDPWAAAVIGAISGIIIVLAVEFIDNKLKIDDPVGAVAVHGANGLFGSICVGLFARDGGLFTTGSIDRTLVQLVGVAAVIAFVAVTMTIVFLIIKHTIGLRVTAEEEIVGLDALEHGLASSYADFMPMPGAGNLFAGSTTSPSEKVSSDIAVPVQVMSEAAPVVGDIKMHKVEIICKMDKFEGLKKSLEDVGITGMTVVNAMGCGVQKGHFKKYRGADVEVTLLPKIKVEVVVAKVPVADVIAAAKKALYTGNIGDGKIFVYGIDECVKVRTGESGVLALQGDDQF